MLGSKRNKRHINKRTGFGCGCYFCSGDAGAKRRKIKTRVRRKYDKYPKKSLGELMEED